MITCTFSGIRYHINPAPARLQWPHPALAFGFDFPKNNPVQAYLRFCAGLFSLYQQCPTLLQLRSPLNERNFSPKWLNTAIYALEEIHTHFKGVGTHRLQYYPSLALSKQTTSMQIESWLDECQQIASGYEQLSTLARDAANSKHALMIRARNKAMLTSASNSATFNAYLERCAIDCGLDDEARYQFIRTCKNPAGSTDSTIRSVLNQLHDWAPQESLDDQLDFDTLVQRLTDALLDSDARKAAKQQAMNAELAKGLFRARAVQNIIPASKPAKSEEIKQKQFSSTLTELANLLQKLDEKKHS